MFCNFSILRDILNILQYNKAKDMNFPINVIIVSKKNISNKTNVDNCHISKKYIHYFFKYFYIIKWKKRKKI